MSRVECMCEPSFHHETAVVKDLKANLVNCIVLLTIQTQYSFLVTNKDNIYLCCCVLFSLLQEVL